MPVNHRTYFGKDRCPKNPSLPKGFCEADSRPFAPHTRGVKKDAVTPTKPSPSSPSDVAPPPASGGDPNNPVFFIPLTYRQNADVTTNIPDNSDNGDQAQPVGIKAPSILKDQKFVDLFEGMTAEQINKAEMSRASYINYNEGIEAAKSFAADNIEGGYIIDEQLSTKDALIFVKGNGRDRAGYDSPDDLVVAYRGTQEKEPVKDWVTNVERIGGIPNAADRDATAVERSIFEKYGRGPIDTTGHSKGGISAIQTSQKTGGRSVTFDPAYSGQQMVKGNLGSDGAEHVVLRTLTDPVSLGTKLLGRNVKIINVRTSESAANEFRSPMDAHDLNHLTMTNYMQSQHGEGAGIEMQDTANTQINENPMMNVEPEIDVIQETESAPPLTAPDRADEFGSLYDNIPADEVDAALNRGSAAHTAASGATAFGVSMATSDLLQRAGSENKEVNAVVSGAAGGAASQVTKSAFEVGTRVTAEDLALAALRSGTEGGLVTLASAPIDVALNQQFRKDGMSATQANALSGASSVVAASAGMYAASSALASVAAGEATLGPEAYPFAATTAAFASVAAAQGALLGFAEDYDRRIAEHNAEIDREIEQRRIETQEFEEVHPHIKQTVASRSEQLRAEAMRESANRLKSEQLELRELLETARDRPEALSIEDAHHLAQVRQLYDQGLLSEGKRDVIQKHDEGYWEDDASPTGESLPPAADFSELAVGADEDTVVTREAG